MLSLFYNASEVVRVCSQRELWKTGQEMRDLCIVKNGAIVVKGEEIFDVGTTEEILEKYRNTEFERKVDLMQRSVVPGFVDSHTHSVFCGDRVHEFAMKLEGKTYIDIQKAGGGIMYTMNHVKQAEESLLLSLLLQRLSKMLSSGTTLVECKSGYGLDLENEVKMLSVIQQAAKSHKISIIATYLPAHAVPPNSSEAEMAESICKGQIPQIAELKNSGLINPEMIDVFCEKGIYEVESTEKILTAGREIGLVANFHGEELNCIDCAVMGARLGARAISHLEYISQVDIEAMVAGKIVAVMLPSTQYILHLPVPPVREMIDKGVIVALGSDFNPNAWCFDMKMIMNLACVNYRMIMPEALVAATINSAASLGKSELYGSIEVGKKADLVVLNTNDWRHLIYQIGDSAVWKVIKHGEEVFSN